MTMAQLYAAFGLEPATQSFTGHAISVQCPSQRARLNNTTPLRCPGSYRGLQLDDSYLDKPALPTVEAIQLYCTSLDRYGTSPYLYPMYGLGGLPEGFSRLCAINGGTFMLNRPVDEVLFKDGVAWGIRCGSEVAKAL